MGGLRIGDNVLWQTDEGSTVDPFVSAFVGASRAAGLVYVSFHVSPGAVLDRLRREWDARGFLLVDCFTDGLGRGDPTFARFYRSRRARTVRVARIPEPGNPSQVREVLAEIEEARGPGARYVFDSLTGMEQLWGARAALDFFLRSCPRLYDLRTVAYWLVELKAHRAAFLSRLGHVTQVVLALQAGEDGQVLRVVKAEGRPEVPGRQARFTFAGGRARVSHEPVRARERVGRLLRGQRLARGLSQAEFARRVGVSPSALSQAERGRIGLSAETLLRAWEALGLPFGATLEPGAAPYQVARRGTRRSGRPAPGLTVEEVVRASGGTRVYQVAVAPGAAGRRPPFATKREEVLLVQAGVIEVRVGQARETLHAGDALVLSAEPVSGWRNPGPEEARALWMVLG